MVEIAIEPDEKNYYDKRWVWFTQDLCVAALTKAVDYCEELKWTKGLGYTSVAAYGSIIKVCARLSGSEYALKLIRRVVGDLWPE